MPLLLRLFFIRRSKNNRRRSHTGSEGRTVFQKNRRARLSGAWTCPGKGLLQRNWRACVQKIPDRLARHGGTHEDKTSSRPGRNTVERALFHNGLCTERGRLQENAACQADANGCARGSVRSFKKIQPTVASLQEDCASRSGAADPVQARAITKSDGYWRTKARGRESARALQRPAEDREGLAAVRAQGCPRNRFLGVLQACWRGMWAGTAGSGSRHGLRDPAVFTGIRDRAAKACREMREPGNTIAHRLCASSLWVIGKRAG